MKKNRVRILEIYVLSLEFAVESNKYELMKVYILNKSIFLKRINRKILVLEI